MLFTLVSCGWNTKVKEPIKEVAVKQEAVKEVQEQPINWTVKVEDLTEAQQKEIGEIVKNEVLPEIMKQSFALIISWKDQSWIEWEIASLLEKQIDEKLIPKYPNVDFSWLKDELEKMKDSQPQEEKKVEVENVNPKKWPDVRSGSIKKAWEEWKTLAIKVKNVEVLTKYIDPFGEEKVTKGAYKVTLSVENTWKEPYGLNSGLWITQEWVQLESEWYKFNVTDYESWTSAPWSNNPWKSWETVYIFDTENEWLKDVRLFINKTNLEKELILDL